MAFFTPGQMRLGPDIRVHCTIYLGNIRSRRGRGAGRRPKHRASSGRPSRGDRAKNDMLTESLNLAGFHIWLHIWFKGTLAVIDEGACLSSSPVLLCIIITATVRSRASVGPIFFHPSLFFHLKNVQSEGCHGCDIL